MRIVGDPTKRSRTASSSVSTSRTIAQSGSSPVSWSAARRSAQCLGVGGASCPEEQLDVHGSTLSTPLGTAPPLSGGDRLLDPRPVVATSSASSSSARFARLRTRLSAVPREEIDQYLGTLDEPKRATLAQAARHDRCDRP